jgi:ABC-2 type transport system ATP-binding protein
MADVVIVQDLHKRYGDVHAVRGLSFTVAEGEIFALVGPNGAGKTTTVEILEGHRSRTSGEVSVLGHDPGTGGRGYRERIGIVLQEAGFDEEFSVRELVALQASLYPRRRDVEELIGLVGLTEKAGARVKTLSGGQRRRLDLALGLAGDPELLFLDEPTTGFDPSARRQAWVLVDALRDLGKTVLLTTHYMDEAEHLADRVAVIKDGQVVAVGSPEQLAAGSGAGSVISFRVPEGLPLADLPAVGRDPRVKGTTVEVPSDSPTADVAALTSWAVGRGLELEALTLQRPSLEDVYLELTETPESPDGGTP